MNLLERSNIENNWLFIPLIILLSCLIFEKQKKTNSFHYSLKSMFDFYFFKQVYKEELVNNKGKINFTLITSLCFISILIFILTNSDFFLKENSTKQLVIYICFVSGYYFLKTLTYRVSGFLFEKKELLKVNENYYRFFIQAIGIASIPVIFFNIIYPIKLNSNEIIKSVNIALFIFVIIISFIRLFYLIKKGRECKISWFHIILYLCTLEISPVTIIIFIIYM